MKPVKLLLIAFVLMFGCKSIQYVPIETVKTEYRDLVKITNDTIIKHDSIHVTDKGDTLVVERFNKVYKFRDRLVRDSIFVHDSIQVPYPVIEIKEVNKLTKWQTWQIMSFKILLLIAGIWITIKNTPILSRFTNLFKFLK